MEVVKNERGYVLVFVTLIITLLLILVGIGLDTGHLSYVRSQGQPAVDAAALAAASAIPNGNWSTVTDQAKKFNPGGSNPGPGMPIVVAESLCGTTATLDFQTGGKSNAGWETYYLQNASATEIRNLWRALPYCSGQPIVDIGYCGYMQNGVDATIFNEILKPMLKADPDRCYLIPVVKNGGNFNQCQKIIDWASFCPDKTDPFPGQGQLYGTVTCGQSTWTSRDTKCYVPLLVRDKASGM